MWGLAMALAVSSLQVPATGAQTEVTRLVAALVVNQESKRDVFVVLSNDDVWVPVAALSNAGLIAFGGERREWFGAPHVSLRSLAPALSYELDAIALVLRITASPVLFPPTSLTLQAARPPNLEYVRSPGLFVNYGATVQRDARPALAVEAGLSVAGSLLSSSFTRTGDGPVLRGLTSLTIDQRASKRRIVIGDTFAPPSLLGSSPLVAGLSIRSQFSLDPYDLRFPLPSVQGAVTTPATAEVYVNDRLVSQESLPPGAFQLLRLPARTGLGDVRVVVRDLLGREQIFGGPSYVTSNVLRPGVPDYHYLVGMARTDHFDRGPTYRDLIGSAFHRVGVTSWLTLGAAGEGSRDVANLGPTVNVRLWRLGEIGAAGAVSRSEGRTDGAASGWYSVIAAPFSATVSAEHVGPHYSSLSLGANDARQLNRFDASVGLTLGQHASILVARSFVGGVLDLAPDPRAHEQYVELQETVPLLPVTSFGSQARVRDSATFSVRIGSRTRFVMSVTRTVRGDESSTFQGFGSLSVVVGPRTVATVTNARMGATNSTSVDFQRSLPLGSGIGYRFLGDTANAGSWNALVQAQGRYGRLSARQNSLNGQQTSSVDVSGGLVWTGGELNLSRRVDDGYALVRVPAGSGIRVYLNDQVVGRTSAKGSVLVPNLLSYLGNSIRIADEDVPLNYELPRLRALVAPPWRGSAVVTFPARPLRAVTGRILLKRGATEIVPAFGLISVTIEGTDHTSPVGSEGAFFLDQVSPGNHSGRLLFEGDSCLFTMRVPNVTAFITDIGSIQCAAGGKVQP